MARAQGSPASFSALCQKLSRLGSYHALSLVAKHRYYRSAVPCTTTTTKHISRVGDIFLANLGIHGVLNTKHHYTHTSRAPEGGGIYTKHRHAEMVSSAGHGVLHGAPLDSQRRAIQRVHFVRGQLQLERAQVLQALLP